MVLPDHRPGDMPRLAGVEVACGKRHMRVQLQFSGPFSGIVFSKGHHGQRDCVYVQPGSGLSTVQFDVFYDKCGTKPDHHGNFYENTIVVQYGVDIIEAWDEAKRLRCEWHDAYEKSALKTPSIQLADLEVQELNFQGDSVGCWMEIQEGKGPWAKQVSSIVPLGSPLTMVVAINDKDKQFDMRVKSCRAHDGIRGPIQLTDERGCVLRPKMLTAFAKVRDYGGRASVVAFSHFYAFKFPDSIEVQIQCVVEICRHGCPDDCPSQTQQLYAESSQRQKLEKSPGVHQREKGGPPSNDVEAAGDPTPLGKPSGEQGHQFVPPHRHHAMPTVAIGSRPGHVFVPQWRRPPLPPPVFDPRPGPTVFNAPDPREMPFGMRLPRPPDFGALRRQPSYDRPVRPRQPARFASPPPGVAPPTPPVEDPQRASEHSTSSEESPASTPAASSQSRFAPEVRRPTAPPPVTGPRPVYAPSENENGLPGEPPEQEEARDEVETLPEPGSTPAVLTTATEDRTVPPVHHKFYIPPPGRPLPQFLGDDHVAEATTPHEATRNRERDEEITTAENSDRSPLDPVFFDYTTYPSRVTERSKETTRYLDEGYDVPVSLPEPVPEPGATEKYGPRPAVDPVDGTTYQPSRPYYPYPVPKFRPGTTRPAILRDRMDTEPPTESSTITEPAEDLVTKIPVAGVVQELRLGGRFPSGPRSLKTKRNADGPSDQLGVGGTLKVVAGVDLAFLPNATRDGAALYRGQYEEVVYGVCLPATGLAAGLGAFAILLLCTGCVSAYLFCVLRTYEAKKRRALVLGQFLGTYRGGKAKR